MATQDPVNLRFRRNQNFFLPFDMSLWAALFDLTKGVFRLQIRTTDVDPVIIYSFDNIAGPQGAIVYQPATKLLIITAPYADMMRVLFAGSFVYDLQYVLPGYGDNPPVIVRDMAYGALTVVNGVTKF